MALIAGVQYSGTPAGTILPCGNGIAITSISAANPAIITTTSPHNLVSGDSVVISGTSTTPSTLATYTVTVTGTTTFTIPVNVTVGGGASGVVSKIPNRMLLCDGTSYTVSAYPTLFAAIGYSFGGSGSNFNVPDFRGRFLRGVDGTASNDPDKASRTAMSAGGNTGNNVGSVQGSEFGSHNHGGGDHRHWSDIDYSGNIYDSGSLRSAVSWFGGGKRFTRYVSENNPATGDGPNIVINTQGGNENRPVNAYVNYCISY